MSNISRFKEFLARPAGNHVSAKWNKGLVSLCVLRPEFERRAEQTEKIDYGCGGCYRSQQKNCCKSCAYFHGHFSVGEIPNDPKHRAKLLELFDEKDGFWTKKKGCVLPRKWRSVSCLSYSCKMKRRGKKPEWFKKLKALLCRGIDLPETI